MTSSRRRVWTAAREEFQLFAASRRLRAYCSMLVFSLCAASAAAAQQTNSGFDSRQTERRFENQQVEQTRPSRPRIPAARFAPPSRTPDTQPLFDLRRVVVSGAKTIPQALIVRAYQPYVGKKVSQADLAEMASKVSEVYREAGFHLSRAVIPVQDIKSGTLRLQVIEGSITELVLKGEGAEEFGLRDMLGEVTAERPSRFTTLERQLLLISARAGVRIQDTGIEEIGGSSGHFRLTLEVKTWHVFLSTGSDNLGSRAVGPWQSYSSAAFNSYLLPGDAVVANIATTPGDARELFFGRLAYEAPVGIDGARLGAYGFYSRIRPGDFRRQFNDATETNAFEFYGSVAPLQTQQASLILRAGLGLTNASETDVFGRVYNDRIRTVNVTVDTRLKDQFGGDNYLTVGLRQGFDGLGASDGGDAVSRLGAENTFSATNFWATRYQQITDALSIKFSGAGQWASGPLFTSQQFYVGGLSFGRGYGSAEISGDNGLAGSVELRFDRTVNFHYWKGYQLYGFFDAGTAWNSGFQLGDGLALTSAGFGARFFLFDDLKADIGVAFPLSYRSFENPNRQPRFLMSLSTSLTLCPSRSANHCL